MDRAIYDHFEQALSPAIESRVDDCFPVPPNQLGQVITVKDLSEIQVLVGCEGVSQSELDPRVLKLLRSK
jgi:hypothetical protein